jgi:rhodanese-related sulfurtransferase
MASKNLFPNAEPNPHQEGLWDVSPVELAQLKDSKVQLIDVRQPEEYTGELGHIEGAKLLPLGELPLRGHDEISPQHPVVFICRSGGRSTQAGIWALDNGYEHVFNLAGGMIAWNECGLETADS